MNKSSWKYLRLQITILASLLFNPIVNAESEPLNKNNEKNKLSIDYLDKMPMNDYIVGPGDKFFLSVISNNILMQNLIS